MNDDLEVLVRQNIQLTKENNRLLHKMRRAALWGTFFRIIWLAVIIGVPVVLYYYFLMPYYENLAESYQQFKTQVGGNIPGFGPLLDQWLGERQTSPTN